MIRFFLSGAVMGTADIIPGVSGGTMAWILGVYERLIALLSGIGPQTAALLWRGRWRALGEALDLAFVLPLGLGIVTAVLVMVTLVDLPGLMQAHPQPVYALFFGLIAASIPVLLAAERHWRGGLLFLLAGTACGLALANLAPAQMPQGAWFTFISGALAISAMLLPGVSGSFILLMLGQYTLVLQAIGEADPAVLLPFALGCLSGLLGFARLLRWALARYHAPVVWLMGGLLLGSLWRIWPFRDVADDGPVWPEQALSGDGALSCALMLGGAAVVAVLHRIAAARRKTAG